MGRAIRIKAYIGYNGKASIDDSKSDVQFCKGLQIVTTSGWISGEGNRESDVSFIQLGSKFTGALGLITYTGTPVQGSESLGIVGYPADKKNGSGEQGAQMWEEFESVKYDLRTTYKNMLEYKISTYAGKIAYLRYEPASELTLEEETLALQFYAANETTVASFPSLLMRMVA